MKYTLEEIKEMLFESNYETIYSESVLNMALEDIEGAIKLHEELSNDNNAEHQ